VPGHSSNDQFSILLLILENYGIVRKLRTIIADNASPNNVLCRLIENYWKEELGLIWKAAEWRIRYIGHIINLVVQAFLFANVMKPEKLKSYDEQDQNEELRNEDMKKQQFRLLGPLSQGHNIVVYIRGSSARTARFKKLAGKIIPMDNRTRWNNWYEMFLILLNLRSAVKKYCSDYENELEKDILNFAD
jgi:nitric oxide reductase activation protein